MERLHVHSIRDIIYRLQQGQSERQIARDTHVSRLTVSKYRLLAQEEGYLKPDQPLLDNKDLRAKLGPGKPPPRMESTVAPYRQIVEQLLAEDVEMTAILARLRQDHGYSGSYSSLVRFVHHLRPPKVEPHLRVHTAPGEEAQVDFSPVGRFVDVRSGALRPAYAFVMTLSFSRHQYAELIFDQKIATWIACHRHAFQSFGGVPKRIVLDNLKAAVLTASLHDPVLGEAYRRLAQHYGCLVSPTRPRTPEHKGKVESGEHYLKRNFLAGQQFADITVANRRLQEWVREVAGTRRHGTTGQAPLALFQERERAALLPLPEHSFTLCEVRLVKVHADCHVMIDGSFYSVPWQHIGHTLEAHVGERVVEIYDGVDLVTTHLRAKGKGEWHTRTEHYPPEKAAYLERTPERCRQLAAGIGPATSLVVESLLAERPLDRLRSVQAILRLAESVGQKRLEAACARAYCFGDARYRRIKDILNAALDKEPLPEGVLPFARKEAERPPRRFAFAREAREFLGVEVQG
ncbi:MAG: IS21 family transposase [Chloroflexi bacterium]|nr:IS21 family transposase [Bacteroidota bacterium]MCL5109864.1 IS21 family transposase [Chloroflexota bacterium]